MDLCVSWRSAIYLTSKRLFWISKEFYAVAVEELIFTTVSGIIAVCFVGFVLIEHWTATGFVLPMILLLYVDLLGKWNDPTTIIFSDSRPF